MSQPVHNRTYLKDRRKELRNNLTPAEAALWKILKNSGIKERKFRRQHSIQNYIVDFYCPTGPRLQRGSYGAAFATPFLAGLSLSCCCGGCGYDCASHTEPPVTP